MRRWLRVVAAMSAFLFPSIAPAQDVGGAWHGILQLPGGQLRLVLHLSKSGDGRLTGTMDSPDQGAIGIPLSSIVIVDGESLSFDMPSIRAQYRGTWNAAQSQWEGRWVQGGSLPLAFAHQAAPTPVAALVDGLDGDWDGAIKIGAGQLRCA